MQETVGIIGGGAIACGLAATAARHGEVVLWARTPDKAQAGVEKWCSKLDEVDASQVKVVTDFEALAGASVIVEAIAEDLDVKSKVYDSLPAQNKEAIKSATSETFLRWWATYQKQSADAIDEFTTKHGVKLLTAPPEVNLAFLKTWEEFAAAESAKNPFFKKVYESQRAYASKVVPAKRFMTPPYTLQAVYYWPNKQ